MSGKLRKQWKTYEYTQLLFQDVFPAQHQQISIAIMCVLLFHQAWESILLSEVWRKCGLGYVSSEVRWMDLMRKDSQTPQQVSDTENIRYQNWEMQDHWLEHLHDSSSIPLKQDGVFLAMLDDLASAKTLRLTFQWSFRKKKRGLFWFLSPKSQNCRFHTRNEALAP